MKSILRCSGTGSKPIIGNAGSCRIMALLTDYHPDWKAKKDHVFAVMPHANGWQLQSRDTTVDKVPETISKCNGFIFRHGSGFMAVVKGRHVAIEFASLLPSPLVTHPFYE